jgi:protein SCO1/2
MTDTFAPEAEQPPSRRWPGLSVLLVSLLIAGLVFWWGFNRSQPHQFSGSVIQGLSAAPDFTLSSDGGPVSLSDYAGKIVMIYFGYTFCPDVCPTTLADAAAAIDSLSDDDAEGVQLIFVTIDPARDTADRLGEYVRHFDDRFVGLTGTEEEIGSVATLYGIYYRAGEGSEATGYLMEHTATLLVIDQAGNLKVVIPFGVESYAIASDLEYMLR